MLFWLVFICGVGLAAFVIYKALFREHGKGGIE
jgi:hypothetical protein